MTTAPVISAPRITVIGGGGESSSNDPLAPGTPGYYAVIICCVVGGVLLLVFTYFSYFSKTSHICPTHSDEERDPKKQIVYDIEVTDGKQRYAAVPQNTGKVVL